MTSQFSDMMSSSIFFWRCFVFQVRFSYWFKFHINIITGSGIMTVFFYKGLTRNPEIGNTPIWVFPNIWRLARETITKFGKNVSNTMLQKVAKCQSYSFYRFWVIKGKPTGGGVKLRLKANTNQHFYCGKTYIINRNLCFIGLEFGWCHLVIRRMRLTHSNAWRKAHFKWENGQMRLKYSSLKFKSIPSEVVLGKSVKKRGSKCTGGIHAEVWFQ